MFHLFEWLLLFAVPSPEGTKGKSVACPQHIVSVALCQLFLAGIELRFLEFQSLVAFAVEVDALSGIEIYAKAGELTLKSHSMVVLYAVGRTSMVVGKTGNIDVLFVFLLHLLVGQQHLVEYAWRISAWLTGGEEGDGECLLCFFADGRYKAELVVGAVFVEVIKLARHLCVSFLDQGRLHCESAVLELHHYWCRLFGG